MGTGILIHSFMLVASQEFMIDFQFYRVTRSDVDVMVVLRDDGREVLARIGHPLLVARYAARVEAIVLRADEVAQTVLWLASAAAGYVTGQVIGVNGGMC
jgi:NAD(P)-dependent dehydrogenase (short-subunit alcohol dehydrogenase family)